MPTFGTPAFSAATEVPAARASPAWTSSFAPTSSSITTTPTSMPLTYGPQGFSAQNRFGTYSLMSPYLAAPHGATLPSWPMPGPESYGESTFSTTSSPYTMPGSPTTFPYPTLTDSSASGMLFNYHSQHFVYLLLADIRAEYQHQQVVSSQVVMPYGNPNANYPPAQAFPSIVCSWDNCRDVISSPNSLMRRALLLHFQQNHPRVIVNSKSDFEKDCHWADCWCAYRPSRCAGLALNHTAHVKDLFEHVYKCHVRPLLKN
jgi:hypothetical protein